MIWATSTAADRYDLRHLRAGGYEGARWSHRRRSFAGTRSRDSDEDRLLGTGDRTRLRLEALDLWRNNALARAITDRLVDAAVGAGFSPQAKTSNAGWNWLAEQRMKEWGRLADYRQRCDLVDLERLSLAAMFVEGEVFWLLVADGTIQPVACDRCSTPAKFQADANVIDGVRVGKDGVIAGYYFLERSPTGRPDPDRWTYREARDVIHLRRLGRIDQIRGVSALAPVLPKLRDLDDLEQSVLSKARLDAKRAFAIRSGGDDGPGNLGQRSGGWATGDEATGGTQYESILDDAVYYLGEGESIDPLESKTPNGTYQGFVSDLVSEICAGVGLAPEFVSLKFNTSYIASRGALISTEATLKTWQRSLSAGLQRLWNWRVAKMVKAGELPAAPPLPNGASTWWMHVWVAPRMVALDRHAEATADAAEWKNGTTSLNGICRERGVEWEDVLNERVEEAKAIMQAAQDNAVPLWMLLAPPAGLPTTDYAAAQQQAESKN